MALYVLPLLVLAVFEIGAHTGDCKIFLTAIKGSYAVIVTENKPPVPVQHGLHGKLVMPGGQVLFSRPIVGIFRADMFECCQRLYLLLYIFFPLLVNSFSPIALILTLLVRMGAVKGAIGYGIMCR